MGNTQPIPSDTTSTSFILNSAQYSGVSFSSSPISSQNLNSINTINSSIVDSSTLTDSPQSSGSPNDSPHSHINHHCNINSNNEPQHLNPSIKPHCQNTTLSHPSFYSLSPSPTLQTSEHLKHSNYGSFDFPLKHHLDINNGLETSKMNRRLETLDHPSSQKEAKPFPSMSENLMDFHRLSHKTAAAPQSKPITDLGVFRSASATGHNQKTSRRIRVSSESSRFIDSPHQSTIKKINQNTITNNIDVDLNKTQSSQVTCQALSQFPTMLETLKHQPSTPVHSYIERTPGKATVLFGSQSLSSSVEQSVVERSTGRKYERSTVGSQQGSVKSRPIKVASRFDHENDWETSSMMSMLILPSARTEAGRRSSTSQNTTVDNEEGLHRAVSLLKNCQTPLTDADGRSSILGHASEALVHRRLQTENHESIESIKNDDNRNRTLEIQSNLTTQPTIPNSHLNNNENKINHSIQTTIPINTDIKLIDSRIYNSNELIEPLLVQTPNTSFRGLSTANSLFTSIFIGMLCLIVWIITLICQQLFYYQYMYSNTQEIKYKIFKQPTDIPFLFPQLTQILSGIIGLITVLMIVFFVLFRKFLNYDKDQENNKFNRNVLSSDLNPPNKNTTTALWQSSNIMRDRRSTDSSSSFQSRLEYDSAAITVGVPTSFNPNSYSVGHPILRNHNDLPDLVNDPEIHSSSKFLFRNLVYREYRRTSIKSYFMQTIICVLFFTISRYCWIKATPSSLSSVNVLIGVYYIAMFTVLLFSSGLNLAGGQWSWFDAFLMLISIGFAVELITSAQSINGWSLGPFGTSLFTRSLSTKDNISNDSNDSILTITLWLIGSGVMFGIFLSFSFQIVHQAITSHIKRSLNRIVIESLLSYYISSIVIGATMTMFAIAIRTIPSLIVNNPSNESEPNHMPLKVLELPDPSILFWLFQGFQLALNCGIVTVLSAIWSNSSTLIFMFQLLGSSIGVIVSSFQQPVNLIQFILTACLILSIVFFAIVKKVSIPSTNLDGTTIDSI